MTTKYFNVKHGITTGDIILDAATGNANVTNANLGNLAVANFFQGDGYRLANLTGANVTGFVPNAVHANTANTVTTAAQPNITSVGTLVSANVSGNLVAANVKANTMLTTTDLSISGKITGDLIPSANLGYDIGSSTYLWKDLWLSGSTIHLGAATISSSVSGTISTSGDSNVSGNLNVTGDSDLGNVATANYFHGVFDGDSNAQPNITSVGTLVNVTVTGNTTTGGIKTDNYYYANGSPVDFQQTAGSTGAIQWNNNGDFGASANLSWNPSTSTLTVTGTVSTTAVEATTLQGSLTTSAQPNITSVGSLSSLVVSANANVGNINSSGTGYISGNLDAGNVTTSGVLKTTNATQATGTGTGALIVSGGASVSKDLYVGGNLYVPNIVSTSSVTLTVEDPLLYLSANTTFPYDYDIGFYSAFSTGLANAGYQHTGIFRNHADNTWYLVSNVDEPTGGVADLSNANVVFDAFKTGDLDVTGNIAISVGANITGNITAGNVDGGNLVEANFLQGVITSASSSQPNITSVGTLTSLDVTANITGGNVNSLGEIHSVGNITAPYFIGNVQGNISGTLTSPGSNTQMLFNDGGSINGNSKVTFNKDTSTFAVTGNITSTNANLGNAVTANYFIGSGANLTSLTGANVTGNVANANLAGYVTEAAQSNITSLGTLTGLGVNGTITASDITANTGVFTGNGSGLSAIAGANVTGTVPNANMAAYAGNITLAAQSNITSVGTLTSLTVSGNISAGNANLGNAVTANYFIGDAYKLANITGANVTGYVANADWSNSATVATTAGTITTNAQPNITSVGTLTSLVVSGLTTTGTLKVTGGFTSDRTPVTVSGNTMIDQFPTGTYRTAKYVVTANADDGYQSVEALLVHNDVGSYITIYGSISSGAIDVVDLTTAVDGVSGNVRLYASNASPNAHVNLVATYV